MKRKEDSLERFIGDHRGRFDDERPSLKVWADIDRALSRKEKGRFNLWRWSVAASVLLLIGIALGVILAPRFHQYQSLMALEQSEEFNGMQKYYNGEVEALFIRLGGDQQVDEVKVELSNIDQQINDLKVELSTAPKKSRELVMEAIISLYEAKVELLEKALDRKKELIETKNEGLQI